MDLQSISTVEVVSKIQPPPDNITQDNAAFYKAYLQCVGYVASVLGQHGVLLDDNCDRSRLDHLLGFRDILHQIKAEQFEALVNVVDTTFSGALRGVTGADLHSDGVVSVAKSDRSANSGAGSELPSLTGSPEVQSDSAAPEEKKSYRSRKNARYRRNCKERKRQKELGNCHSVCRSNAVDTDVRVVANSDKQSTCGSDRSSDWTSDNSVRSGVFGITSTKFSNGYAFGSRDGISDLDSVALSDCVSDGTSTSSKRQVLNMRNQASILYWQSKAAEFRTKIAREHNKQEKDRLDNLVGGTKLTARCRRLERDNKTLSEELSKGVLTYSKSGSFKKKHKNIDPISGRRVVDLTGMTF